jgi:hypothetical protein
MIVPINITDFFQINNQNGLNNAADVIEPKENQICLVENKNGYFVGIKIKKVIVKDRGDINNLLVFDYQILEDRSCNFSRLYQVK